VFEQEGPLGATGRLSDPTIYEHQGMPGATTSETIQTVQTLQSLQTLEKLQSIQSLNSPTKAARPVVRVGRPEIVRPELGRSDHGVTGEASGAVRGLDGYAMGKQSKALYPKP
jgi:hypothetical protein